MASHFSQITINAKYIIYRVSHFVINSKCRIKILFDGSGYGIKIYRTVSYVYWLLCTYIEDRVKLRVKGKLILQ